MARPSSALRLLRMKPRVLMPLIEAFEAAVVGSGCCILGHKLEARTRMHRNEFVDAFLVIARENCVEGSERLVVVAGKVHLFLDELVHDLLDEGLLSSWRGASAWPHNRLSTAAHTAFSLCPLSR